MINDLRAMAVFAKTVETGSFRAAASALGLSPSVVSHHVSQLETRLGVALLYRSTRRLSLTQDGKIFFEHAQTMLTAAERGFNALAQRVTEPAGTLSVTVSAFLSHGQLMNSIASFARAYPGIALELDFSDQKRDLICDGIDLAIRVGELEDSTLKTKKLFDIRRKLVVAPRIAKGHPRPQTPEELADWEWIGLQMRPNRRTLTNTEGESRTVRFEPRVTVNSLEAVCQLSLEGLGLATPPAFMVEPYLEAGRLVEPLPNWRVSSLGIYAVWPQNAPREGLTFRLLSFLEDADRQQWGY
jgi:DNA-binding transcriptional LysR family regulator